MHWANHGRMGTRNPGFGYMANGLKASWKRIFLIFYQIFVIFEVFWKVERVKNAEKLWKIIKFGKNWRKSLFNLPPAHLTIHVPKTWVLGTHYTFHHDSPNANITNFDHAELLTFSTKQSEDRNFPMPFIISKIRVVLLFLL